MLLQYLTVVIIITFILIADSYRGLPIYPSKSWSQLHQSSIRGEFVDNSRAQNLKRMGKALGKAITAPSRPRYGEKAAPVEEVSDIHNTGAVSDIAPLPMEASEYVHSLSSWKSKRAWRKSSARHGQRGYAGNPHWHLYCAAQTALLQRGDKLHFTKDDIILEDKEGHFKAIQRLGCSEESCVRHFDHHSEMVPDQHAEAQQFARLERDLYKNIRGIAGRGKPQEVM